MHDFSHGNPTAVPRRIHQNLASFMRLGAFSAAAMLFSVMVPPELLGATLSSLMAIAAAVSAMTGALASDRVFTDHLTRWDEAAILLLIGVVVGAFTGTTTGTAFTA